MTALVPSRQLAFPLWREVIRCDEQARALVDGESVKKPPHYSRQTPGARDFMGPGRTFVLLTADARAVWGVIENQAPRWGGLRWRCSMFRNESGVLSSDLIRSATALTVAYWWDTHGMPPVWLTTEVDPRKTREKQHPGFCFRAAGWRERCERRGLVVLEAPR